MKTTSLLESIIALLEDPAEEWTFSDHVANHAKTGVQVWISNGQGAVNLYPVEVPTTWNSRRLLWRAVSRASENFYRRKLKPDARPVT